MVHATSGFFVCCFVFFEVITLMKVDYRYDYDRSSRTRLKILRVLISLCNLSQDAYLDNGQILKQRPFQKKSSVVQGT